MSSKKRSEMLFLWDRKSCDFSQVRADESCQQQIVVCTQSLILCCGLLIELWHVAVPLWSLAVQDHHQRSQFFQGCWLFAKSESGKQVVLMHVLAAPAPVPHQRSSSVRVSLLLRDHKSLWMDIPISPIHWPPPRTVQERRHRCSHAGNHAHCTRLGADRPRLSDWWQQQPLENPDLWQRSPSAGNSPSSHAPEMIFQLSNIKVCWTDKMTVLFWPLFPGQTDSHKVYSMYLQHPLAEEDQPLLQWLRSHRTSGDKAKSYDVDKVLVGVKFVSIFNPLYFYQYLTMHYPHWRPSQLSSQGRQHAAIHSVLRPGCCSDSQPLVNAGHHHQPFFQRRTQGLFPQYHHFVRQVLVRYPAPLENTRHRWGSRRSFIHLHGLSLPPVTAAASHPVQYHGRPRCQTRFRTTGGPFLFHRLAKISRPARKTWHRQVAGNWFGPSIMPSKLSSACW